MKKRVGDTLIEVTLAIGIFSMVAISIVAVMNGGTSSAQTALETTLAREEIDTQAEALRFIHHAYIANLDANSDSEITSNEYVNLWKDITKRAIVLDSATGSSDEARELITNYEPTSCDDIYGSDALTNHAFIIDPRSMQLIYPGNLQPTPTYPRLLFGNNDGALLESGNRGGFYQAQAQGIYVLAVKDPDSTNIVNSTDEKPQKQSAYFDFYIRTCWYGNGDEFPSSISTTVRLYDPDPISNFNSGIVYGKVVLNYHFDNTPLIDNISTISHTYDRTTTLKSPRNLSPMLHEVEKQYEFQGYCPSPLVDGKCNSPVLYAGEPVSNDNEDKATKTYDLYPIWKRKYSTSFYDSDGTLLCKHYYSATPQVTLSRGSCTNNPANRPNQEFKGWSPGTDKDHIDDSRIFSIGEKIELWDYDINLYPAWRTVVYFSDSSWTHQNFELSDPTCVVFNYNEPSSGTYCQVKAGESSCDTGNNKLNYYADKDNRNKLILGKAPADGYLVKDGQHIETTSDGIINLQGYCKSSRHKEVNEGVYYEIGPDDTFELSANMNTAGMSTHPGGSANISIGPLTAKIADGSITYQCGGSSKSASFTKGNVLSLKITKYDDTYALTVNSSELGSCASPTNSTVRVGYSMEHGGHGCDAVFNVQLTDIKMQRVVKE